MNLSRYLRGRPPRRANPEPQTVSVETRMCALRDYVQALLEPDMDVFGVHRVVLWSVPAYEREPERWRLMYARRSAAPVFWLVAYPQENALYYDSKNGQNPVPDVPGGLWDIAPAWRSEGEPPSSGQVPADLLRPLRLGSLGKAPLALWPNLRARRAEPESIGWSPRVLPAARGSRRAAWNRNTSVLERAIQSEIDKVREEGWLPPTLRANVWVRVDSPETWGVQVNVLDCPGVAMYDAGDVDNEDARETQAQRAIAKTLASVVERFEVATGRTTLLPAVQAAPMGSHQAQEREFLRAKKLRRPALDLRLGATLRAAMRDSGCENDSLEVTVAPDGQWQLAYRPDGNPSVSADVESPEDGWEIVKGWMEEFGARRRRAP